MKKVFTGPIEQDPAIINLLERMPESVRTSFSEVQLSHLRNAVSSRQWGHHKIDFRGTFPFLRYRYYYVFIAGKNQRTLSREEITTSRWLNSLLLAIFLSFSTLLGLLLLYLAKSALGIDLIPGHSLGIWDWFKSG